MSACIVSGGRAGLGSARPGAPRASRGRAYGEPRAGSRRGAFCGTASPAGGCGGTPGAFWGALAKCRFAGSATQLLDREPPHHGSSIPVRKQLEASGKEPAWPRAWAVPAMLPAASQKGKGTGLARLSVRLLTPWHLQRAGEDSGPQPGAMSPRRAWVGCGRLAHVCGLSPQRGPSSCSSRGPRPTWTACGATAAPLCTCPSPPSPALLPGGRC